MILTKTSPLVLMKSLHNIPDFNISVFVSSHTTTTTPLFRHTIRRFPYLSPFIFPLIPTSNAHRLIFFSRIIIKTLLKDHIKKKRTIYYFLLHLCVIVFVFSSCLSFYLFRHRQSLYYVSARHMQVHPKETS